MRNKKDNFSQMFHLSYDTKSTTDTKLKEAITWAIIRLDVNALLDSPVESTILIETYTEFQSWEKLFSDQFRDRMYYVISEVRQTRTQYLMDEEANDVFNNDYKREVEAIRTKVNEEKDAARMAKLVNYNPKEGQ